MPKAETFEKRRGSLHYRKFIR